MNIIVLLFISLLILLALWRMIRKWQVNRRLEREGSLVYAQVVDIKQEARLATQLGWSAATCQTYLKYELFLYARYKDPLMQDAYTFRIQISRFDHFTVGEPIRIVMNKNNPHEYRLAESGRSIFLKRFV
jgi:hypothetical protein